MTPVLLALLALLEAGVALSHQRPGDVASIEANAVRYAMTHFLKGAVALDTTNAFMLTRGQSAPARSPSELAHLRQILNGAKVGALSDFRVCARSDNPNTCELRGTDAVLSMSRPTIKGDSAVVTIRIFTAQRSPTGRAFTGSRSERIAAGAEECALGCDRPACRRKYQLAERRTQNPERRPEAPHSEARRGKYW